MKNNFIKLCVFTVAFFGFTSSVFAQMYGTGMQGAMMACPYGATMGDEAQSIQDDISEQQQILAELKADLRGAKADRKESERKMASTRASLERRGIQSDYLAKIIDHVTEMRSCGEYEGNVVPGGRRVGRNPQSEADVSEEATVSTTTVGNGLLGTEPYKSDQWAKICDSTRKGRIKDGACSEAVVGESLVPKASFNAEICRTNLKNYQDAQEKFRKQDAIVATIEARIESAKAAIADMKGTLKEAQRDYAREQREQMTEGGCVDCMLQGSGLVYQKPKTDWGGVVTNLGLGIASIYLGNNLQKYVANQNARIGAQTQGAYPSFGFGFPFMMGAIGALSGQSGSNMGGGSAYYGAVGGGMGAGGFGCANGSGGNGYGMGGATGYPAGYYASPYGGGAYSGMPMGMYGAGMAMGGGMGMQVGGGMMMSGGMGMGMPVTGGYPMGMMAGGGYPMGSMMGGGMMSGGGMPMGMMMSGGAGMMAGGGYPMGSMMGGGMMSGGGMPMGMMMSGGAGMMAGGGYPMGSMMGGGMMSGGGMPMGMMMSGGAGMMAGGGYPMGSMMGGGGMMMGGGMGMMSGMGMDSSAMMQAQMQMQQQMMQMQMQQQQAYMQAYQQAQESAMNKQRVVMGLQQELQSLVYRIQQVQYGTSTGGYLDTGAFYGGSSITNSPFSNGGTGLPGSPFMNNNGTNVPTNNGNPSIR